MQLDKKHPPHKLITKLNTRKGSIESGLCLVEGWKCFAEAHLKVEPEAIILEDSHEEAFLRQYPGLQANLHTYPKQELKKCSSTTNPEGIIGLFKRPQENLSFPESQAGSLHLIIYQWRDPGNIGTVVRSARGLGISSVSLWGSGPDFFSPRVIRGSMGSVFHLNLNRIDEAAPLPQNGQIFLGTADGQPAQASLLAKDRGNFLLIGSESHGFDNSEPLNYTKLSIPLKGELESLSAPIAASLLMDRLLLSP